MLKNKKPTIPTLPLIALLQIHTGGNPNDSTYVKWLEERDLIYSDPSEVGTWFLTNIGHNLVDTIVRTKIPKD
jgi:hypothetical protein